MLDEELIVEVRTKTLARVGVITPEYRQMKVVPRVNDVGTWELTLPGAHPMVTALQTPGSGIIVTQITGPSTTRVVMSGPTTAPTLVRNRDNPDGLLTFTGVSDSIIAADAVAYGDPTNLATAQTTANDVRTGKAETLMRAYVNANVGPGAIASRKTHMRQYVALATDGLRGPTITKSPRFQNLLELLQEIALYSSLTFRFVQVGSSIVFEVGEITDRSALVRLDIETGTLESEVIQQVPAGATRAIVAGQGEGTARLFVERTTTDSTAAETNWGRVIERFLDARDKSVTAELQQQGDEYLIANGAVDYAIKASASDSQTMRYGIDWFEGDLVAVIVDGTEQKVNVVGAAIVDGSDGVLVGMSIGDIAKMERATTTEQRLDSVESRVSTIERSDDSAPGAVAATPGTLVLRDGSGKSKIANPSAADEIDNKGSRDSAISTANAALVSGTINPALALKFGNIKRTVVTATSNFTPDPNALLTDVEVQGDGGAGGGRTAVANTISIGGGGGAGGYRRALITPAQIAAALSGGVIPVTIGAGGVPGTGATGGNGTGASFGALVTATGGLGGVRTNGANTGAVVADGGAGGTSGGTATPDLVLDGAAGSDGRSPYNSALGGSTQFTFAIAGAGADSRFGQGGQSAIGASGFATAGRGYGSGGSGMYGMNQTAAGGGAGAPAIVIITEYLSA